MIKVTFSYHNGLYRQPGRYYNQSSCLVNYMQVPRKSAEYGLET